MAFCTESLVTQWRVFLPPIWPTIITAFLMFLDILLPFGNAKGEKYYSTDIICHPCCLCKESIDSLVIKLFNTAS